MRVSLPFANGFYRSNSKPLSAQECVNCYPEPQEVEGVSTVAVWGCPGISQLATTGDDANRGGHVMNGLAYVVNGEDLVEVGGAGATTTLGSIVSTERCVFADNGTQLMILVPGVKGYIYTEADGLVEITDPDFTVNGIPIYVTFVDGYFVCVTSDKRFTSSALNDGTSWNGTDVGTAESDPDAITAAVVLNNQLYLIGTETTEQFANRPRGADFPFQRTGNFSDYGSGSRYSIIKTMARIYFVGSSKGEPVSVYEYSGTGQPTKVSTFPIDSLLQSLNSSQISDIVAWAYSESGHHFVGFNLGNTSIVYDISTGQWHERKSTVTYSTGIVSTQRYRVSCVLPVYGKNLVGDLIDGRIGVMDLDYFDEYGEAIRRRIVGQPFQNQGMGFFVPMIEMWMEPGVGNSDTEEPEVRMSRSIDGRNWTDTRGRDIGKVGEYDKRQIWYRNGRASRWEHFAFETSAKCKIVFMALFGEVKAAFK